MVIKLLQVINYTCDFVSLSPYIRIFRTIKNCSIQQSNISDALVQMEKAMKRDNIEVNDRQLACAHIKSQEGQDYLKAMAAAANFAWVNRSSMTFLSRQVS